MSKEKEIPQRGFRIKWADREVEYYGDATKEVFDMVFEHVKSTPITFVQLTKPPEQTPTEVPTPPTSSEPPKPTTAVTQEYNRIINDAKVTQEQLLAHIKFEKREGFTDFIPYLPKHPKDRDAIILVSYGLQVGLQMTQIDVTYLRKLLKGPNGYPFPGNQLGKILENFRDAGVTISSQTQARYKPFTLSTKGLDKARELLKNK